MASKKKGDQQRREGKAQNHGDAQPAAPKEAMKAEPQEMKEEPQPAPQRASQPADDAPKASPQKMISGGQKKGSGAGAIAAIIIVILVLVGIGAYYSGILPMAAQSTTAVTTVAVTTQASTPTVTVQTKAASTTVGKLSTTTAPTVPATLSLDMYLNDYRIDPATVTVMSGEHVTIDVINNGTIDHDLVIADVSSTEVLTPGESEMITFVAPAAGTYSYYSNVQAQREEGLSGNLIVTS